MKSKTSPTRSTPAKNSTTKKPQLRDLAAKQAGNVKGGAIRRLGRTGG